VTTQTYLVMIRDGQLALTVANALEERLLRDGHHALALVLTARGLDLAGQGHDTAWQLSRWPAQRRPQVVALYEEGLLGRLESLGMAAYVGVPEDQDWRVIRWNNQAGAIMLPVATARDLVEAVADHSPWSEHAVPEQPAVQAARRGARWPGLALTPALRRKIVVTSAGPLLLAGLPTAAGAAVSPAAPLAPNSPAIPVPGAPSTPLNGPSTPQPVTVPVPPLYTPPLYVPGNFLSPLPAPAPEPPTPPPTNPYIEDTIGSNHSLELDPDEPIASNQSSNLTLTPDDTSQPAAEPADGTPTDGTPNATPTDGTPNTTPTDGTNAYGATTYDGTPNTTPSDGTPNATPSDGTNAYGGTTSPGGGSTGGGGTGGSGGGTS
jgi:hypothetical protein